MDELLNYAIKQPISFATAIGLLALLAFVVISYWSGKNKQDDRAIELTMLKSWQTNAQTSIDKLPVLQNEITQLTQDLATCKNDSEVNTANAVARVHAELQGKITKLETRITELETDLSNTQKERDTFKRERNSLHADMVKAQIEAAKFEATANTLREQNEKLYKLLAGFQRPPEPPNGNPKPSKIVPIATANEADSQKKAV